MRHGNSVAGQAVEDRLSILCFESGGAVRNKCHSRESPRYLGVLAIKHVVAHTVGDSGDFLDIVVGDTKLGKGGA